MLLTKEELVHTTGGGSAWILLSAAAAGFLTFLFGTLDGIFRPLASNK